MRLGSDVVGVPAAPPLRYEAFWRANGRCDQGVGCAAVEVPLEGGRVEPKKLGTRRAG